MFQVVFFSMTMFTNRVGSLAATAASGCVLNAPPRRAGLPLASRLWRLNGAPATGSPTKFWRGRTGAIDFWGGR
jgi:hypothetical protein